MTIQSVLLPLFVEVLLTFILLFWAGYLRISAVAAGTVDRRDVDAREPRWPPHVLRAERLYESQLELPVLFYVLTILALMTKQADLLFVAMAWSFVALRAVHAVIYIRLDRAAVRAALFFAGAVVLALMWTIFFLRILLP